MKTGTFTISEQLKATIGSLIFIEFKFNDFHKESKVFEIKFLKETNRLLHEDNSELSKKNWHEFENFNRRI